MTHQTAYSLGLDAANDQMRQAGRIAWNEDDAELAAHTINLHFPLCMDLPGIRPELCGCAKCCSQSDTETFGQGT